MCCLGFYALACGANREEIMNVPDLWHFDFIRVDDGAGEDMLMEINDDPAISDDKREEKLTQKFQQHGIKVNFVD